MQHKGKLQHILTTTKIALKTHITTTTDILLCVPTTVIRPAIPTATTTAIPIAVLPRADTKRKRTHDKLKGDMIKRKGIYDIKRKETYDIKKRDKKCKETLWMICRCIDEYLDGVAVVAQEKCWRETACRIFCVRVQGFNLEI